MLEFCMLIEKAFPNFEQVIPTCCFPSMGDVDDESRQPTYWLSVHVQTNTFFKDCHLWRLHGQSDEKASVFVRRDRVACFNMACKYYRVFDSIGLKKS